MQRLNKEVAAAEKDLAPLQKRLAPLQAKAKALEAQMDNAGGSPLKKQKEAVAGLQQVLSAATLQGASLLRITRLWPPQPDRHPAMRVHGLGWPNTQDGGIEYMSELGGLCNSAGRSIPSCCWAVATSA